MLTNLLARLRLHWRPLAGAVAVACLWFVMAAVAHAQDVIDPPLTEEGASLFEVFAKLYVVLGPIFTQRITEWLRTTFPAWEDMDGKAASMNVALIVFGVGAVIGLAVKPEFVLPDVPTGGALLDYASYLQSILLLVVGVIGWFVAGGRGLHAKWKARIEGGTA